MSSIYFFFSQSGVYDDESEGGHFLMCFQPILLDLRSAKINTCVQSTEVQN